jgi:hypothetical protein
MENIAVFSQKNDDFKNMGISLLKDITEHEQEQNQIGGNLLSHLYIPGGLFTRLPCYSNSNPNTNYDHTKINVMENFDIFIDLVSEKKNKKNISLRKKQKQSAKKLT